MKTNKFLKVLVTSILALILFISIVPVNVVAQGQTDQGLAAQEAGMAYVDREATNPSFSKWKGASLSSPRLYYDLAGNVIAFMFAIQNEDGVVGHVLVGNTDYDFAVFEAGESAPPTVPQNTIKVIYLGIGGQYAETEVNSTLVGVNLEYGDTEKVTDMKAWLPSSTQYKTNVAADDAIKLQNTLKKEESYNGVTVTGSTIPNNYKIQFTGSDSNIIIGDGSASFTPSFTVNRWGETSFTLTLASPSFADLGNGTLSTNSSIAKNNIINFSNSDTSISYNAVDNTSGMNELGGLDFAITLKAKPTLNNLVFNYSKTGVSAYLQPSLTKEWSVGQSLGDGNYVVSVTDTDVMATNNQIYFHRPDYAVNSIVFYDSLNGGLVDSSGKDYKTGKIGQLYRMKVTDSSIIPQTVWADWSMPTSSTMQLSIAPSFLSTAKYPVKIAPVGDTFGYTSAGGGYGMTIAANYAFWDSGDYDHQEWWDFRRGVRLTASANGTITTINAYVGGFVSLGTANNCDIKMFLNDNSGSQLAVATKTSSPFSSHWETQSISAPITSGSSYYLSAVGKGYSMYTGPGGNESNFGLNYDSVAGQSDWETSSRTYSYAPPPYSIEYDTPQNPWNPSPMYSQNLKFSIYCTYTPVTKTLNMSYYQNSQNYCGPCSGVSIGAYYRDYKGYSNLYSNPDMYSVLCNDMNTNNDGGATFPWNYGDGFTAMTSASGYGNFTSDEHDNVGPGDYFGQVVPDIINGWPVALCYWGNIHPTTWHWVAIKGYDFSSPSGEHDIICTDSATGNNLEQLNWDALPQPFHDIVAIRNN